MKLKHYFCLYISLSATLILLSYFSVRHVTLESTLVALLLAALLTAWLALAVYVRGNRKSQNVKQSAKVGAKTSFWNSVTSDSSDTDSGSGD